MKINETIKIYINNVAYQLHGRTASGEELYDIANINPKNFEIHRIATSEVIGYSDYAVSLIDDEQLETAINTVNK